MFWGTPQVVQLLKTFTALVVPGEGCRKGIILQRIMTPTGVLPNEQLCLRIKGNVTGASVHAPRQRNIKYVQTFRRSIHDTRQPEHPHLPILRYERRPQGPSPRPRYTLLYSQWCPFVVKTLVPDLGMMKGSPEDSYWVAISTVT